MIGNDRLLVTAGVSKIFVSPRRRAQQTLGLLNLPRGIPIEETADLCEWNYGAYEGISTKDIKTLRSDGKWDIWTDGCPGGESPEQVRIRVDSLIEKIRRLQRVAFEHGTCGDCVCVAHAHVLRAFTARWIDAPVSFGRHLLYDAGKLFHS